MHWATVQLWQGRGQGGRTVMVPSLAVPDGANDDEA